MLTTSRSHGSLLSARSTARRSTARSRSSSAASGAPLSSREYGNYFRPPKSHSQEPPDDDDGGMYKPSPDQHNKWRWLDKTVFNAKKEKARPRARTRISKSMARGNGNILQWGGDLAPVPEERGEWGSGKLAKHKQLSGRRARARQKKKLTHSHSQGTGLSSAPFATSAD